MGILSLTFQDYSIQCDPVLERKYCSYKYQRERNCWREGVFKLLILAIPEKMVFHVAYSEAAAYFLGASASTAVLVYFGKKFLTAILALLL